MTPRDRFQQLQLWYQLTLYGFWAATAYGYIRWLGPGRHPDWLSTTQGHFVIAAWTTGFLVYLMAMTRLRCPKCGARLRLLRDLGGLRYRRRRGPKLCPRCGLNLDEEWPPLTTVEEAVRAAEEPINPIN